ncbi:ubiquitin carboxyl-terminal hydrolase 40-like [Scleropages formosus]|uniref:Ubiquitin carboxyl-terminal hydrolase 40-like n=1 Tax=Scleropages formosus TaxID=113540 RepID=A0A0P7UDR7_SCLFO|nr:ubiquitin carboxyl-terminal hydrolase 40-like [Scleropages formosus]
MFGNLFEEDEEDSSFVLPGGGGGVEPGSKKAEPPAPRGALNLSGLQNQGGTCYLNSLLQTLLFSPEFREELFSLGPEELGCLEDKDKQEAKVRVIPLELQRLFAHLLLVDQQAASTADLTDSFGWTNREESSQHDVQELNRILFSALESSLVGTTGSSLIHRLYHGTVVNQIVCKVCGYLSESQEDFLDLTVSVSGVSGLEEALWNMFVEEEMFEGNNLYRCSRCNVLVEAAKSAKLRKLPPFLTMSLLRFNFDFTKCERYKETGRYTFPLSINLKPFCEQAERPESEYTYELFSVIIHKGGCYGGHYHVYIKDIDQLGNWEAPEEELKPKFVKKEAQLSEPVLEKEDPLSVLIAILSQEESKSILVDQLGQKLLDTIGVSWNKKFRKQYGPIGKFLHSHSDVFMLVSNATRVALKSTTLTLVTDTSLKNLSVSHELDLKPADGPHWFDLNDSTVTPIHERDIEKQFQGKESAYMLFYRKAELCRPEEAKQNPSYKVPPHLLRMVQEENARLRQRREEFESSTNTVEVHLHLAPHYQLENGALWPKGSTQDSTLTLNFDRRRTVGDFRQAIYQMQDTWEGDMALTLAKSLPAGLHLYNTLTDDQQSLFSAGVTNGSDLFVWNGREVCGTSVQMGSEWEPVLLTLLRASNGAEEQGGAEDASGSGLLRVMRGFPGGTTLEAVCEALGPEDTLLCQEESQPGSSGGGASNWRVFPPSEMHRTLKELSLKDGDTLLVLEPQVLDTSLFSLRGDVVTVTTPSDCRWLQVEFRPRGDRPREGKENGEERRREKISASGNMLLSEVKQSAIEQLDMQEQLIGVECCLRQVDHTGKLLPPCNDSTLVVFVIPGVTVAAFTPFFGLSAFVSPTPPVREDLTVREAGVKLMTSLFLCRGAAPGPTQLFLYFTVSSGSSTGAEMEIMVEESITVKEVSRNGDASLFARDWWHLRKMDWCEEVGDPLMDEDASLTELKIGTGDTLVVTEGQLPPKGFLKLPIWMLGESDESFCQADAKGNHVINGVGNQREGLPSADGLGGPGQFAGHVEISVEASLDDLKIQVLTLPILQDLCVPTPAFLRVWLLEGRRPSRILRGRLQPLKKMKLRNGMELGVQRLLKEEDLGLKELLLWVKIGVPGERKYYPSEELVWDAGREGSPRSLRQAIAAQYGLSADSLHMAKYCPEKYTWMAISSWSQQVSKRKKKKKAENLYGAPFHLKDGDIIGVKNLLIDSNKDFSTLEDELEQQRLQQEAEGRKRGRGQNGGGEPSVEVTAERRGSGKQRKPEVALSINVGHFR